VEPRTGATERWRRVRALFDELVELAPAARAAALESACGADADLRGELAALLEAAERPDDFLARAPGLQGAELGPFRLGGVLPPAAASARIGRVVRAQARDGRDVALRLVPVAPEDVATLQRLRSTARALAALAHPALVRVLETGLGPRPEAPELAAVYFASELVAGAEPLAGFARRTRLGLRTRLARFREACSAIAAAHAQGLVHGNLSAANVVVDARGAVRVLDLGVAAVCGPSGTDGELADVGALGARLAELLEESLEGSGSEREAARALVLRTAHPDPRQRPRSMAELVAGLPHA
jgi:eukaryotic-like serine/threonine-protein kinase